MGCRFILKQGFTRTSKTDNSNNPHAFFVLILLGGLRGYYNKIMDTKTSFLLEQITQNCNRFNVPISPNEGKINTPNDLPFTCTYMVSLYINSNKMGHGDLYVYLNGSNYDLVAVGVMHATSSLLNIMNELGQFYGVTYTRIEKIPYESESYYIYF